MHGLMGAHAWALPLFQGRALLIGAVANELRAVLHVRFGDDVTPCPTGNAQTVEPEQALVQLQQGRSWAVLICCGDDQLQSIYTWLMRLRQSQQGREATVLTLVDDLTSACAPRLLRAGADLVLPYITPSAQLSLQIERLAKRLSHTLDGVLELAPGLVLIAATCELEHGNQRHALPPQSLRLLWALGSQPSQVLSIMRLRMALDIPAAANDQALHTAVARLRRQLRPLGLADALQTLHRVGYRWSLTPQR